MSRLIWNAIGTKFYEAGVDRGVLFLDGQAGIPWNGLTGISENASGGEAKPYYIDGVKYLNLSSMEEFEATLTAYTYPVEFGVCDGTARVRPGFFLSQQRRQSFGLCYRTLIGNDISGTDFGYKIHLVYNALATPSDKSVSAIGKDIEASEFSWKITTKPIVVPGYSRTAHMVLDSRDINPTTLGRIEDLLYGNDTISSSMPTFAEIIAQLDEPLDFTLVDNGDGTFTVGGPVDIVTIDPSVGTFTVNWPTADYNGDGTYTIGS